MSVQSSDLLVIERSGTLYKATVTEVEAQVKTLAGYKKITVSSTAPASPSVNDLWVDTT